MDAGAWISCVALALGCAACQRPNAAGAQASPPPAPSRANVAPTLASGSTATQPPALTSPPEATPGGTGDAFASQYGSSLLNSQVLAPRRHLGGCTRHAIHYAQFPDPERGPPFALVVSPDGRHGVLSYWRGSDELDQQGVALPVGPEPVTAFNDFAIFGATRYTWQGSVAGDERTIYSPVLVRRLDAERFVTVWIQPAGTYTERKIVETLHIVDNPRDPRARDNWGKSIEGVSGVAAIASDFTTFVALSNRRLMVFADETDANGESRLIAQNDAGITAGWISLASARVMLLAHEGNQSRLRVFSEKAKYLYSARVPFEVLQPAVAGAGKRVYLAGKGLAAIDEGKLTWSHESGEPLYVSSFEDGSLAVANGKRLDFLKPDGTVDQRFEAQEPLVAPPAIASDGSVWAASATALYIAR